MQQIHRRKDRLQQWLGDQYPRTLIALIYIAVIVTFFAWFFLTHLERYE